ncbi:YtzC family protein [Mesobacillus zeae]|uniref:DUF2524 family protein n=1 Tax=Mesobacillus zeae TaxID=1917180 RepID=A0A398AZS9_9BACI|nr:YtzC family protein [Mesobacillus zeae]RID83052.1 DUF2524 family protein [Mesobacillus zeae]
MATRQSVEEHIQVCENSIVSAREQYEKAGMQEHYNEEEYTSSLQQLETAYNDLAKLAFSCNSQQRERLHRMRLQLQQLQNSMILRGH